MADFVCGKIPIICKSRVCFVIYLKTNQAFSVPARGTAGNGHRNDFDCQARAVARVAARAVAVWAAAKAATRVL